MANKDSYVVDQYQSDFGDLYFDIRFSVDRQEQVPVPFSQPLPTAITPRCGGARRLFSMRKGILVFTDNTSIELPIPTLAQVPSFASVYGANPNVACIVIKGEKWKAIPPGILGGNYAVTPIDGATKPAKSGFQYRYYLDGGGANDAIIRNTSIETLPSSIFVAQQECLDKILGSDALSCGISGGGLKPRRFKGQRSNSATGGVISRQIIVSQNTETDIKTCGATVMTNFNCLGYEGTSIENAQDYYVFGE